MIDKKDADFQCSIIFIHICDFLIVEQVQQVMPTQKMSKEQKKRKGKTQIYKGPRKSKKTG